MVESRIAPHAAKRFERALGRALELFDMTARDARWRGPRLREILRAREEFCRLLFDPDASASSATTLSAYFLQFAGLARRARSTVRGGASPS